VLAASVSQLQPDIRQVKSVAGPVGELGHAARGQPKEWSDLRRRLSLDLDVPQHRTPALW
jgi:hypothetical protein